MESWRGRMNPKTRYTNEMRKSRQNRRLAILEAAEHVFTMKGIERTTMQEIANLANLGIATVFRYFPKKEKLIVAVVTKKLGLVLEAFSSIAALPISSLEKLEKMFDSLILLNDKKDSTIVKLLEDFDNYAAHLTEPLEDMEDFNSVYKKISNVFSTIIEQGMKDHSIRSDFPIPETLTTVINTFGIFSRKLSLQKNILTLEPDLAPERQLVILKHILLNYLENPS